MRWIVAACLCVTFIGGWAVLSTPPRAAAQEPASYLALVAPHRGGPAPGTGDVTIVTLTPAGGMISGSIPTTGNTVELAAAPDGEYVIALSRERLASIITGLDTGQPEESRIFPIGDGANAVAVTPDSSTAVILNGQDDPPSAMIVDGLPDAPRVRTRLPIPGAIPGTDLDIAMFASGDSAAISTGCGGLSLLDGILTDTPTFRAGSPFRFTDCIQGLAVAPDDRDIFTASLLSGRGFAVLRISGAPPGERPFLAETGPLQSSTLSNLRLTPDGSTLVVPGFQGIFIFRNTDMGISPPRLIRITGQLRTARQGGAAISPDGRLALVANIDVEGRTTLSIIADLLTDEPAESGRIGPDEMVNTRPGAQQSIVFVPLPVPPAFVREQEPNDSIEQANLIVPDVTVLGTLDPAGDADFFGFDAEADQQVVIETRAQRLSPPSAADTVVTLFDSQGTELAENDDAGDTFDSRLEFTLPASGRYFVRLRESRDKGGPSFTYEAVVTLQAN